jgi:hypothetical protein
MHLLTTNVLDTLFCLANAVGSVLLFFFYTPPSAKQFSMNLSWALVLFAIIFPPHDDNQVLSLISLPAFGSANCALQRVPQAPRHIPSGMLFNLNPQHESGFTCRHCRHTYPLILPPPYLRSCLCSCDHAASRFFSATWTQARSPIPNPQHCAPPPPAPHLRIQIGHRTPKAWAGIYRSQRAVTVPVRLLCSCGYVPQNHGVALFRNRSQKQVPRPLRADQSRRFTSASERDLQLY